VEFREEKQSITGRCTKMLFKAFFKMGCKSAGMAVRYNRMEKENEHPK
jgi:hypothetical protein